MQWVKAGSGAALDLLAAKSVDMILVHAPGAEREAVSAGWATRRTLIGCNEFYILGPKRDPAAVHRARSAADAFQRIARAKALFLTRADRSGTHEKELQVWKRAQVEPRGTWYIATRDFMAASLKKVNDAGGYFMADSSTWVAQRQHAPALEVLFRGDRFLINAYHGLVAPEGATLGRGVAGKFLDFAAGPAGQEILRSFGAERFGEPLYRDASYARPYAD